MDFDFTYGHGLLNGFPCCVFNRIGNTQQALKSHPIGSRFADYHPVSDIAFGEKATLSLSHCRCHCRSRAETNLGGLNVILKTTLFIESQASFFNRMGHHSGDRFLISSCCNEIAAQLLKSLLFTRVGAGCRERESVREFITHLL